MKGIYFFINSGKPWVSIVIPRMRAPKIPMNKFLDVGPSLHNRMSFYKLVSTDFAVHDNQ
jgi:hypothetical protein